MFIDESVNTEPQPTGRLATVLMMIFLIPTLCFGLYWQPVVDAVDGGMNLNAPKVLDVANDAPSMRADESESTLLKDISQK